VQKILKKNQLKIFAFYWLDLWAMAREAGLTSPGLVSLICRTHAAREKAHKNLADLLNEKVPINVKEKSRNSKNLNLNVWTARIQPPGKSIILFKFSCSNVGESFKDQTQDLHLTL